MNYRELSLLFNIVIAAVTILIVLRYFRGEEGGWDRKKGRWYLHYFTTLSNVFAAGAGILMILCQLVTRAGSLPAFAVHLKFLATVTVTVTLLTVLFFLSPQYGLKALFVKEEIHMHLVGPVLSIVSFCFLEKQVRLGPGWILAGVLPVFFYALLYLQRTIVKGEENGGWPDFYGFNRNGMWRASFVMMMAVSAAIAAGLRFLHNMGI